MSLTMNNQQQKCVYKIHGMHCASCEVLIERKFKKVPGVEKVSVSHTNGRAEVYYSKQPKLQELQNVIKPDGYNVSMWGQNLKPAQGKEHKNTKRDYMEIGAVFLIVMALYLILKQFRLLPNLGISSQMSYGFIFLIGLVAATSTCIAVAGGLLLAIAGKYNEQNPDMSSAQKFKPHIYFNIGRVISYTAFGALIGGLGSVFTLSPKANGIITILASLVMIILGFQLLKLFPWMKRFQPKMPKFLSHKIHDLSSVALAKEDASSNQNKTAPFLLGAATFFLPCGFTQALQLYVLSQGSFKIGALTMLAFSLGTLPGLLSLSAISSFAKGGFQRYFLKFSGVVVIMLGLFNVNNGLALTGSNISLSALFKSNQTPTAQAGQDPNVKMVDGKQIVQMKVQGLTYTPNTFTVVQGVPVEWQIDGSAAEGCAQVITIPKLGKTQYLSKQGVTTISFTPQDTGVIPFSCTMGMTTRGSQFNVVPNTLGTKSFQETKPNQTAQTGLDNSKATSNCDPSVANCVYQQFNMQFSYAARGFYPNVFTARVNQPVELLVDVKDQPGGCMGTIIVPKYDVAQTLALGKNVLRFTPTETGTVKLTCSMGIPVAEFNIIN